MSRRDDKDTRRNVLLRGGTALLGLGAMLLPRDARPTPWNGSRDEYLEVAEGWPAVGAKPRSAAPTSHRERQDLRPTPPDMLGPFWRAGSPFRGKTTPPRTPGRPLLVRGRIWSLQDRRPLPGVTVDVWHAGDDGRYRDDGGEVLHRIRLVTDNNGDYEYEAVLPGHYGSRPRHIHYRIGHPGHAELITQLYFEGDPQTAVEGVDERLIKPRSRVQGESGVYDACRFDVVLTRGATD